MIKNYVNYGQIIYDGGDTDSTSMTLMSISQVEGKTMKGIKLPSLTPSADYYFYIGLKDLPDQTLYNIDIMEFTKNENNDIYIYSVKKNVFGANKTYSFIYSPPCAMVSKDVYLVFSSATDSSTYYEPNSGSYAVLTDIITEIRGTSTHPQLYQVGIQGASGQLVSLNHSEFRIGPSGFLEINDENIPIMSCCPVKQTGYPIIIDYKYPIETQVEE